MFFKGIQFKNFNRLLKIANVYFSHLLEVIINLLIH